MQVCNVLWSYSADINPYLSSHEAIDYTGWNPTVINLTCLHLLKRFQIRQNTKALWFRHQYILCVDTAQNISVVGGSGMLCVV